MISEMEASVKEAVKTSDFVSEMDGVKRRRIETLSSLEILITQMFVGKRLLASIWQKVLLT